MIDIGKHLQVGQVVQVEELVSGYRLTPVSPDTPGHTVVDVGIDFVVLDDASAQVRTRIPGHLIKPAQAPVATVPQAA
jgi:hypothetical protein